MAATDNVIVPPGYSRADLDTWSHVCATGQHSDCTGRYINPDPEQPGELPCTCGICNHDQTPKKRGRPRKQPAQ
ncbi:hypothetical protein ACWCSD_34455 [Nonomuraea sp. NPDC001684]